MLKAWIVSLKKSNSPLFKVDSFLIFSLIFLLPTQLGKHFWPDFSYVSSIKIDYYSPTFYLWDLLLIFSLIYFLVRGLRVNKGAVFFGLIFLLSQALSLFGVLEVGPGLVRFEQLFVTLLLGILIASLKFKEIKKPVYLGLLLGVLMESLISIGQFLASGSIGLWILGERDFSLSTLSIANFNFYGEVFLRPYGTFPHPNVLSAYLVLALPLIFVLNEKRNFYMGFPLLLGFLAILLSFSRGAIFFGLLEGFYYFKEKIKILVLIGFLLLPLLFVRFNSAFNFDSLSLTRREDLALIAGQQFLKEPLFGGGLNSFIKEVSSSRLVSGPSRFLQPVHNIFLLELAETGIVGLLGFLMLIIYPIWKILKVKKDGFGKVLLFEFSIIFVLGMIDHYFLTIAQGERLFFLLWGLALNER